MTTIKKSNTITRFFQSVADVVTELLPKERAVDISSVFSAVQKKLDENQVETEYGYMSSGYVTNVYVNEDGVFAICNKSDGKLYKITVAVDSNSNITLGEEQEVVQEFTPVSRGVTVLRQTDGQVRWFAMPACTAVLDRSGEIDSRKLFDSFVEHVERTGKYPELDFFHLGEHLTLGIADYVARNGVSYIASGTFYDTEIARAAIVSLEKEKDYWGLSIAYIPTEEPEKIRSEDGIEIDVFNGGINRFISLLPESTAASIWTSISTNQGVDRMNKVVEEALKKLAGGDTALLNQFTEKLDSIDRSAEEPGVITRDNKPAPAAKPATSAKPVTPAPVVARTLGDEDLAAITAAVTASYESDEFRTRVNSLFGEFYEERTKDPAAPAAEAVAEEDTVEKTLKTLSAQVEELVKARQADDDIASDMPAKIVSRGTIIRPRQGSATILPSALNTVDRSKINLSEIAERTLEKMEATE